MKFSINKANLLNSLESVIKAIDTTNIYIHLRNFYVEVLDEFIIIKGSNGYFSIESKIDISKIEKIESIGSFLIPSTLFINVIRKCDGLIEIESKENILYIKNGVDNYEINLLSIADYPTIDFSLYGNKLKVDAEKFRKAIDNVIFATSQSNEEMILSGVNIKYESNNLIFTATDSFRLARETIKIKDDRNISFDVTIVNKNIKNFIPSDIKGEIEFYANEHKINVIHNLTNYQSKIIDAPYKNVSNIFNLQFPNLLKIDKTILVNAINKATAISGESAFNRIKLSISAEQINLSAITDEIGKSSVVIEANKYEYHGEKIDINLNYKFLKDAINVFNDKINVNLTNSLGPIMITSDNNEIKQIISPMMN